MLQPEDTYWETATTDLFKALGSAPEGLTSGEVAERLKRYGRNVLSAKPRLSALRLFARQFASPLILILVFAVIVAGFARDWTDAAIVLAILFGSGVIGFVQEYRASNAVEKLRSQVRMKANVLRDGKTVTIASEEVVPGDVVVLSAGSLVPADGVVIAAKDFFVVQAALTGEPLPVEKAPGVAEKDAGLSARNNSVFMGTSVRSGTARALMVRTGGSTVFGGIAGNLRLRPPETEFERGIRRYGLLLSQVMLVLVIAIFAVNVFLQRPPVDSLIFAIALAVGMSPELLPAIISLTLSHGAREMAKQGVIVRHLSAIENLGSMDILCTDKTGTLTEAVMALEAANDAQGKPSLEVIRLAVLNATFQTGLSNPLDDAIIARGQKDKIGTGDASKLDEVPYDFVRKCLSVVIQRPAGPHQLILKGALDEVLGMSRTVRASTAIEPLDDARRQAILTLFEDWSAQGYRVLGVATKDAAEQVHYTTADEAELVFEGFLLFLDPLKPGIAEEIDDLAKRGVTLKMITGDNRLVSAHIAKAVGLANPRIMTGKDLKGLSLQALSRRAEETDIFAEIDPNQKEQIILAVKKAGHVVGYLGDGINDAPALHAADVGISVDQAVDVARDAADLVLQKHDLKVLSEGIEHGRRTFANTLKYISITTSANFGNMISMALASMFLPFLPLLAKQILLNNFLSDLPSINIASDNVDPEMIAQPHRWSIRLIRRSMIVYGSISSVFDIVTFGVLLLVFQAKEELFQTGWFVESLLTELFIVFVIRTYRPFFRSTPGRALMIATAAIAALTLVIPYLPFDTTFGFVPLPLTVFAAMIGITIAYIAVSELAKGLVRISLD